METDHPQQKSDWPIAPLPPPILDPKLIAPDFRIKKQSSDQLILGALLRYLQGKNLMAVQKGMEPNIQPRIDALYDYKPGMVRHDEYPEASPLTLTKEHLLEPKIGKKSSWDLLGEMVNKYRKDEL